MPRDELRPPDDPSPLPARTTYVGWWYKKSRAKQRIIPPVRDQSAPARAET